MKSEKCYMVSVEIRNAARDGGIYIKIEGTELTLSWTTFQIQGCIEGSMYSRHC